MKKEKVCQDVPEENGSNVSFSSKVAIKSNPLYKYDFVINNYTELEVCQVKQTISKLCKKGGFGFEIGEECKTPHLQGYLSLKVKQRITGITKLEGFERASLRAVRNEDAMINYIQKDGNAWLFGFPKPIKIIEELYGWQKEILEIYNTEPDDRKVYWFWEDEGCRGKTAFIKYMIVKHQVLFCSGGKYSDIMNLVFNQDMDTCKAVMFNLPRASQGKISYSSLESIKDGMVCNTKYETGVKVFNSPHLFVFANFPPEDEEKLSSDRWIIREL